MTSREARIGLNEAVFREVNDRIEDLAQSFELGNQPLDLICECGDASCVDRIHMTHDEYERLRSESDQFAISPGHVAPDVETVVARCKGYDIVKKDPGVPRKIAESTDSRTD